MSNELYAQFILDFSRRLDGCNTTSGKGTRASHLRCVQVARTVSAIDSLSPRNAKDRHCALLSC